MKQTMLEDDDALKNKSNSSGSCLDAKNSNGLPDLNEPFEPVAVSRDITYLHNGKRKNSNGLADLNEPLQPVAVSRDVTNSHNGKRKNSNGLADLNEPLKPVAVSRDVTYPHNGRRKNTYVEGQRLEKSKSKNRQMVLEAGTDRITQIDPVTDHSKVKVSEERTYGKLKVGSKKPQVSYDGYLGSSSVASKAPRSNDDFFKIKVGSSFEMESHVSNGLYQGFSAVSKQPVFSQSFQNLQGPRKQEGSDWFPWLKPQPPHRSDISNGWLDFNASTNQFMDWTDTRDNLTSASAQKSLWSASYSNNANMGRVDMINSQIKRDHNIPFDPSVSSVNQHGPKVFSVDKEKQKEAAKFRHQRKLKMKIRRTRVFESFKPLPSFENKGESLQEKPNEKTWGLKQSHDENKREKHMNKLSKGAAKAIVAISSSNGQPLLHDAVSSSTDAATKDPL